MAMFKAKQDSEQRKIRLPKRTAAPGLDYLEFIIKQAFQYQGQEIEINWAQSTGTSQFSLVTKVEREKNDANWKLWEDDGRENKLVWSHDTVDLELIENMLSMLSANNQLSPAPTVQASSLSPISPYRNLLSASYHGITPATNNLRDSLIHMRALAPQTASSNNLDPIQNAQTVPTGAPNPISVLNGTPSSIIKETIADGLKQLAGNRQIMPVYVMSDTTVTGTLEQTGMQNSQFIALILAKKLSGKLEFTSQESRAEVFFLNGEVRSAFAANSQGNEAMTELLMFPPSSFRFTVDEQSPVQNINENLETLVTNALSIGDQLSHLEKAGLKPQALIVKVHENLGDRELKLFLMKNQSIDINTQIALYKELDRKLTLSNFLGKRPMSKSIWVPIIFNFFACGLIEIKPPLSINDEQLEFLGDAKAAVQALKNTFTRKETGILSYPALLYFLQYEFLRFQSYDWPLSLVIFEMSKQSPQAGGGHDLIDQHETLTALQRIAAIKRPLDHLGHFEAINYALLLPNTSASAANQIAHQIIQILRAEPLSNELEEKSLKLSFGIASIPAHCGDLESIIILGKKALSQAKNGHFPVILAQSETQSAS